MGTRDTDMEGLMVEEDPEFERILQCVFGIQPHESRAFYVVYSRPGSTVSELSEDLNRDRSNVNRSLSTLQNTGLIEREKRLLDGGGYVFQYFAIELTEVKQRMHITVDEWSNRVHSKIDEIDGDTWERGMGP